MRPAADRGKKILIVEDEREVRGFLAGLAALRSRAVLEAEDGQAGLQLARRELPDLILLDMKMPRMNGLEVVEALQAEAATAGIPVMILTSTRFDGATRRLLESLPNVKAFVSKTAGAKEILTQIDRQLRRDETQAPPGKVLVVDDEPHIGQLLSDIASFKVKTILRESDGEAALATAQAELPDLILLDMKMPRMNGVEVLEGLRERPETAQIPVIVLTSSNFDAETKRLVERFPAVKGFLPKMGGAKALMEALDRLLP